MSHAESPLDRAAVICEWRLQFHARPRVLKAACQVVCRPLLEDPIFDVRIFYNDQLLTCTSHLHRGEAEARAQDLRRFLEARGWR